jgi:hypothetical protein
MTPVVEKHLEVDRGINIDWARENPATPACLPFSSFTKAGLTFIATKKAWEYQ